MNLSPKSRFLKSAECKTVADILAKPEFHRALEVALSEMQLSPPKGVDAQSNWNRLEGAKQFVSILLNLADPPAATRRGTPRENLTPI